MISRILLAIAALALAIGGALHASVFAKVATTVANSNIPSFFGNSLKLFWLNDSAVAFILAAILTVLAIAPHNAKRPIVMMLALIPAAIGVLLYAFLGNFFAAPFMLVIAALIFAAGLFWPAAREQRI